MTRAEPVDDEAWEAMAAMIADRGVPLARLADLLDALDPERRPRVVRRLGRSLQRTLYERAEGHEIVAPASPEQQAEHGQQQHEQNGFLMEHGPHHIRSLAR